MSYDGPMCSKCHKALACYSIEWSELPDNMKCKCKAPGYPKAPIDMLGDFLKGLVGAWKGWDRFR